MLAYHEAVTRPHPRTSLCGAKPQQQILGPRRDHICGLALVLSLLRSLGKYGLAPMQIMFTMLDLSRVETAPLFEYVQQRQVLLVTQSPYQTLTDSGSSETFALHHQRVSTLPWRSRRATHYIAKPPNDEPGQFVTSLTITSRIHSFRAIYTNLITRVPWQFFACPSFVRVGPMLVLRHRDYSSEQ
jgi:hypothetical protein